MKNATKILFGVVAILVGIIYVGDTFDVWDLSGKFDAWWTLFLIIPAIGSMISSKINVGNSILLALGLWLFVLEQGWFDDTIVKKVTFSVILVIIGIALIYTSVRKKNNVDKTSDSQVVSNNSTYNKSTGNSDDRPSYFTVFGSNTIKNVSKNLVGGDAFALFGGLEIDLSDAMPNGNVTFNVTSLFGGVDVIAPKGFDIVTDGISLLGGCDNKVNNNGGENLPIFTIKYFTLFGGVDIL